MAFSPTKKYAYYIRGKEIAIVEWDTTTATWVSPKTLVLNGLQLEYTLTPAIPANADDDIDIDEVYAHAVSCYLMAMKAERAGDLNAKREHMREFNRFIHIGENNKIVGIRKVMPHGTETIK